MSGIRYGGCQCGALRYEVTTQAIVVYACHCTICQTQSGSAFGMAMRLHKSGFRILQGDLRTFSRTSESGQVFTNAFCPKCGTRIYHAASKAPDHISLKPGTLDDTTLLTPSHHVFARSAQPWVIFPDDAKVFETVPANRDWLSGE